MRVGGYPMETRVDEIAERIYRLSTFLPAVGPKGLTFNQFLVDADEPLLFHCGQRALYQPSRARRRASWTCGGCAGSPSATSRPTSAAPSRNGSTPRRRP